MDKLPNELLEHIFDYCGDDFGGLISTCKRFHAVIIASKFLKKKCVGISFFDDIKEIKAMKKYRNVQNLIVRGIIDTRGYKNLFRDLRVLTFFGPIFKNPVEWRRVFGSLAHLENLAFERGKLSSSVIFETACKSNKFHLTEFKLDRIVIKSAAKESVIKFLKKHTSIRKLVIKVLKSFEEIWPLVVQDMSSLEHFEFSWNVFSLETIKKVDDVNLNIRQLTISGITELEYQDEGNKLEEIIKRFPRVTRLVLLPRVYLENPKMQVIATHLPYLQDLDMYEFESDELVEFKGTFPNLQRLSINTWCLEDQTIENLETFVIKFSSVMHLVIKQIKRMDDEYSNPVSQLNFLIQNLPELRILEIGGRFMPKTLIEDTVAKNCHNLKIFKFPAAVYRRKAMNLRDIFKDVPQLQVAAMEDEYFGYHTYYPVYDLLGEEIKSDDDDNFYTEDLDKHYRFDTDGADFFEENLNSSFDSNGSSDSDDLVHPCLQQ